jgi:hypothetical protein
MSARNMLFVAIGLLAAVGGRAIADDETPPAPAVRPHEPLDVGPSGPLPATTVRRAEALVASLARITQRRPGLTEWQAGGPYFEPTESGPGAAPASGDEAEKVFQEVVALGPAAMPVLLAHLDDSTPTGLVVEHGGGFGGMWLSAEVDVNPALVDEVRVVNKNLGLPEDATRERYGFSGDDITRTIFRHVVTVGDVCFALLGQITNRPYEAVRGQPTACIVVNSPTSDPRIAGAVRAQWEGRDIRRALAQRLDSDLWTTDVEWPATGALERLLAWYPDSVQEVVVRLLDAVDPVDGGSPSPDLPGGIDPGSLASSAGTIDRPSVRAALVRLAGRARDAGVLRAALQRLPDLREPELHDHIVAVIRSSVREVGNAWAVEALLGEIATRWPDRYPSALSSLLKGHGIEGVYVVVSIAHSRGAPLPLDAWRKLLDVPVKATEWQSSRPKPLERLRVCDVAAGQIARLRPDLPFDESADTPVRDQRIRAMRRVLDAEAKEGGK